MNCCCVCSEPIPRVRYLFYAPRDLGIAAYPVCIRCATLKKLLAAKGERVIKLTSTKKKHLHKALKKGKSWGKIQS